jgi:hypothetical protein
MQRSENRMQSGRIFYGRLWLKKGCFSANDDDYLLNYMLFRPYIIVPNS